MQFSSRAFVCLVALLTPLLAPAQDTAAAPQAPVPFDPRRQPINPDRPGIADGSQLCGVRVFQVEMGAQYENHDSAGVQDRALFVPMLVRYGLTSKFEARIETSGAYAWESVSGGGASQTSRGFSPVSIGIKYAVQDTSGPTVPSIGVIVRLFPASGSAGFGTQKATYDARVSADWWPKGKWQQEANLGIGEYEDANGKTFTAVLGAATLTYNFTDSVAAFIDTGVQSPEQPGQKLAMVVDTGLTYLLSKNVQLDLSIGSGVSGQAVPRPFIAAGISWRHL